MDTVILNNGVKMPLVGLGTWNLRGDECVETVANAISLGYHLIDTAQMYDNETEVGKGIVKSAIPRNELFVTTKIYRISGSYEKARKAIDTSLQRLGLDYIDLMLLHEPYKQGPQMYRALEEALQEGKVRAIGISNYDERWYTDFIKQVDIVPTVNQLEAHVYFQKWNFQKQLETSCTKLQAWAPLAQGIDHVADHPVLKEIGREHNKSAAQVALRFLVERGISVIPKSRHSSRLAENLNILDFSLSDSEMETIKTLDRDDTLFT
ncbi:MAG: aldo/keto reductase [bacterium]|nr:aldo/keto reductase [bacterium]